MLKTSKTSAIYMPTEAEDKAITAAAMGDPDAQPLSNAQLSTMVPLRGIVGRPKSNNKKRLVSIRFSPEVISYFKSTGERWQSQIDNVLRQYVTQKSMGA